MEDAPQSFQVSIAPEFVFVAPDASAFAEDLIDAGAQVVFEDGNPAAIVTGNGGIVKTAVTDEDITFAAFEKDRVVLARHEGSRWNEG